MYTIYHIPAKRYVGCTTDLKRRMSDWWNCHNVPLDSVEVLWETDDIVDASIMEKWEQFRIYGKADSHYYHIEHSEEKVRKWKELIGERTLEKNLNEVSSGTHPWMGEKGSVHNKNKETKKVISGTHVFLKRPDGSSVTSDRVKRENYKNPSSEESVRKKISDHQKLRAKKGIHQFQHKKRLICEYCSKNVPSNIYAVFHGIKCKNAPSGIRISRHVPAIVECEHCGKSVDKRNYARWHGMNCRKVDGAENA